MFYKQNENDLMIESGGYKILVFCLLIGKFFLENFLLGYKQIFLFAKSSKKLLYKCCLLEKISLLARFAIVLLGTVNTILAVKFYIDLLGEKNDLLGLIKIESLLGLKYFLAIYLLGLAINIKNLLLDKYFLARQKKWQEKFEQIKFKDCNNIYPELMEIEKEENIKKYFFDSFIPLEEWTKKIEYLKQIFNSEIDIEQYEKRYTTKIVSVPNEKLKPLIKFDEKYLQTNPYESKICIGLDIFGRPLIVDFDYKPHGMISGDTGSGKSTLLKVIYVSLKLLNKKMVLIDLKGSTLKLFKKYEKDQKIYTNIDDTLEVLQKIEKEHDKRLRKINEYDEYEDIHQFNKAIDEGIINEKKMREVFILIDEIARITVDEAKNPKTFEITRILTKIAQLGRSQGFHLLFITQRPDADTLPTKLRAMLGLKISGPYSERYTSEMAINDKDAFKNFPQIKGRMLILIDRIIQFQVFFIQNKDIDTFLKDKINQAPKYKVNLKKKTDK